MNIVQCPNMLKSPDDHFLPSGFWSGFTLFSALWLAPVLTLIILASS